MLQLFRSGLTSYFATALLGLLIASFALWGISGDILSGAGNSVAQIGDDKITLNDYAREFQNKFSEIQQQSGGEVTRDMVIDRGLTQSWVSELVQRKTFAYAAHDMNIRVTDEQLRDFIMSIESFQDTLGEFSKAKFEDLARYRGYTSSEFEEILRKDLERQYLMTSLVSSISVPDTISNTFIKYLMEERTAEIVTVPAFSITNIPTPDEATLQKYYQDNSANYMAPEYRDIRFITVSTKDFENAVSVTEEEIEQALGTTAENTGQNEKRNFYQILFDDQEAAQKAHVDLVAGKSFNDIIIETGSTEDDAAVLENSMQDATDSYGIEAAEAIFTTDTGKYTKPVETDFGWRLFNVTKVSEGSNDTEKLRSETIAVLKNEKALDLLYNKSEKINDELAAGASLSDLAETLGLGLSVALNVDRTGYNAKGDLVSGLPTDPAFLNRIFDLLEGDEPQLEELDNDTFFLAMVDSVQPTSLRPFEDVKTSVVDIWQADARKNMAREQANSILEKAADITSLEETSSASDNMSFTSVTLARNDQTGKVARTIQSSIFSQNIGETQVLPASDGNGFVVVKVLSRKFNEAGLPQAQSAQLNNLLVQEYQQRLLSNYWRYLENNLPVIINERAIKAVHDQLSSREQ